MTLLSLVAKLGLNSTGFEQGLNKASKQVSGFGAGIKTALAGAFSVAAITGFLRGLNETIGRIKDLSEQFGVTTDDVQNIDYAMKQSGMSFEDFGAAMNKLGQSRREAATGNEELTATFARFGVTAEDLQDPLISNKDMLLKVAEAMRGANVTAAEQAAIMDLLGPKAAKLANVLAGLDGFKAPTIISNEDIERIDRASKSLDNMWLTMQKMAAPIVGRFAEEMDKGLKEMSQKPWWQNIFTTNKRGGILARALGAGLFGSDTAPAKAAPDDTEARLTSFMLGKQPAQGGKLWDVPEKRERESIAEIASVPTARTAMTQADQLGRIGAFSGGPSSNVGAQLKRSNDTLTNILRALEVRGIKLKEF